MKFLRRAMLLALFVLPGGAAARAADNPADKVVYAEEAVFAFTPEPQAETVDDLKKLKDASEDIRLRPNAAGEFFLYAFNPDAEKRTYLVDVKGGPGSALAGSVKATIPAKTWVRVRVPKAAPAPAAPPAAAPVPAAAAAAPAPPAEKPPPGAELAAGGTAFGFTLSLLNEDGTPATDTGKPDGKPYGHRVKVTVQRPDDYVEAPAGRIGQASKVTSVALTVTGKPAFAGTASLTLDFPPQPALAAATIREGLYKRTLARDPVPGAGVPKATVTGKVANAADTLRVHLGIDGLDRAFIYLPVLAGDAPEADLIRDTATAVRIVRPGPAFAAAAVSQPVAAFPLKVEADNDPAGSTLELWLRRQADGDDADRNEVFKLGGARDERVWVDTAGPLDAGFLVSDTSKDWVAPIDLRNFRGKCEVVAVLRNSQLEKGLVRSAPFPLTIDANAPERVEFADFLPRHFKGKPLTVTVTARDEDSKVEKVAFVVGKPLPDGKFGPDAVTVEGVRVKGKAGELANEATFAADLPLPPDKRGLLYVTAVLTDTAGNKAEKLQVVEIVDAPPPLGTIAGVVVYGERRQPGLVVRLLNAKGEEKATALTDANGKFVFAKLPLGDYVVFVEKPDSSYGSEGKAGVALAKSDEQVAADLVARKKAYDALVEEAKKKNVPPPEWKPDPVKPVIVLVKRTK